MKVVNGMKAKKRVGKREGKVRKGKGSEISKGGEGREGEGREMREKEKEKKIKKEGLKGNRIKSGKGYRVRWVCGKSKGMCGLGGREGVQTCGQNCTVQYSTPAPCVV